MLAEISVADEGIALGGVGPSDGVQHGVAKCKCPPNNAPEAGQVRSRNVEEGRQVGVSHEGR